MSAEFKREYLLRLPLPLAQLYARAYNAKDAHSRHNNTYYLFEVWVKLTVAIMVATYARRDLRSGQNQAINTAISRLNLPALGDWVKLLRLLCSHFALPSYKHPHPLGYIAKQITAPCPNTLIVNLFRRIKQGPDGIPVNDTTCNILDLIEALVQYRNLVFGHGAQRSDAFYAKEMGPLLFGAVNELLDEETVNILGPRGSRLVYLTDLRQLAGDRVEIGLRELIGTQSERTASIQLTRKEVAVLDPETVAVIWPGTCQPLRLDPMVVFREGELCDEMLFLNRDRNGKQVEYLSYTTGRTERDPDMAPSLARLLSMATGEAVSALPDQANVTDTSSTETTDNRIINDYELISEIGRGGMGVVYLARQLSLNRLVALKTLPDNLVDDAVATQRFRREMRALSECDHPNIIKVLQSGTMPDGHLFYTMEYVPGCDLEQVWQELATVEGTAISGTEQKTFSHAVWAASSRHRLKLGAKTRGALGITTSTTQQATGIVHEARPEHTGKDCARGEDNVIAPLFADRSDAGTGGQGYVRKVCMIIRDAAAALQVVHDHNLIHRDIKPANLLLTSDLSRVVLMDFGLAKSSQQSMALSGGNGLIGTLRYAAPEQLAAKSIAVGVAADIRGLGVTLWELLTRRRLFAEAEDECRLAALIQEVDVPRLRTVDPSFDKDIEAIVSRATERRVIDRIPTAEKLADYLQLYLDNKPLPIRPPTSIEMIGRWIRKHRGIVWSASLAFLVVSLSIIVTFCLVLRSRAEAIAAKIEADRQREAALKTLVGIVTTAREELRNISGTSGIQQDLVNLAVNGLGTVTNAATPRTADSMLDLATLHWRLSQMMRFSPTWRENASNHLRAASQMARGLHSGNPRDLKIVFLLSEIYGCLGDNSMFDRDFPSARRFCEEQLTLLQQTLSDDDKESYRALSQLHSANRRMSRLELTLTNTTEALSWCEKSIDIAKRLESLHPDEPDTRRVAALSFIDMGDIKAAANEQSDAFRCYSNALVRLEMLAEKQPYNRQLQRDRSNVLMKQGESILNAGEPQQALPYYREALKIRRQAALADPGSSFARLGIAFVEAKLGIVFETLADYHMATQHLAQAESILQEWMIKNDVTPRTRALMTDVSQHLNNCLEELSKHK